MLFCQFWRNLHLLQAPSTPYNVMQQHKELKRDSWEKTTGLLDLRKDGKKAWTLLDRLSGKNKRTNSVPLTSATGGKVTTDAKKS